MGKGQKPGVRNNSVPRMVLPALPHVLLALGSKGTLSWGMCPHFLQGVEESLPGPLVVEASPPPQIAFPAPALPATGGPKFCLCPPTLCSISGAQWNAFRGFCSTTPGSPPMTEG